MLPGGRGDTRGRKAGHVTCDDVERRQRHRSESCKKSSTGPEWSPQLRWDSALTGRCIFSCCQTWLRVCVCVKLLEIKLNFLII